MTVTVPRWLALTALIVAGVVAGVVLTLLLTGGDGGKSSTGFEPWPQPIKSAFFRDCGTAEDCSCIYEQLQLRVPADEAVASFEAGGIKQMLLRDLRKENDEAIRVCLNLPK